MGGWGCGRGLPLSLMFAEITNLLGNIFGHAQAKVSGAFLQQRKPPKRHELSQ